MQNRGFSKARTERDDGFGKHLILEEDFQVERSLFEIC